MDTDEPDQKDVDAIFAWLDAPDRGRAEFDKIIDWVLSEKRKYLPEAKLSKSENEIFNAELERLQAVVSYLNKVISKYDDPTLLASFYDVAIGAFVAGNNIGQYGEPISPVKAELKFQRAYAMGKGNKADNDPGIILRRKLLDDQAYDIEELATSRKACGAIEEEFEKICKAYNEKAKANGQQQVTKATSSQTIQRDALAIIELRHKSLRHY